MRYLESHIRADLGRKMVFLGGPRQVGKTTLARSVLESGAFRGGAYFTWDLDEDRRAILKKRWREEDRLLVFDAIHKFPRWKGWLKGLYDTQKEIHKFLVTGSARLDLYRRGGDSLFGRYHYWRLHPFDLSELPPKMSAKEGLRRLLTVGGFPEPFLDGGEGQARWWRRERFERILREDVRDLEPLREIQTLGLLVDLLRQRVSSPVVLSHVAGDLQVSPGTTARWLEVLERMYMVFVVRPLSRNIARAVVKPPKVYFFDNMDILGDEGARFENLVATHLLKRIQFLEDRSGYRYELRYLRDKEKREVDFVILRDGVPEELVEAKVGESEPSRSLLYYAERLKPKRAVQIVRDLKRPYSKGRLEVVGPVEAFRKLA